MYIVLRHRPFKIPYRSTSSWHHCFKTIKKKITLDKMFNCNLETHLSYHPALNYSLSVSRGYNIWQRGNTIWDFYVETLPNEVTKL